MSNDSIFPVLKKLAEIPGPVGREEKAQQYLETFWNRYEVATCYDRIGNLFGKIEGEGPHWAIVGHADSIGFIVQQILPDGFLKVSFNTATKNPDGRYLPGTEIWLLAKGGATIPGYFGLRSGHLADAEERRRHIPFEDMFVDIGVGSAREVRELGIDVGTSAIFGDRIKRIQHNIVGPAMDNRVAGAIQCLLLPGIAKMKHRPRITLISTVQEEIGLIGASAASRKEEFDRVIAIDVGLVGDIPTASGEHLDTQLGMGPIILYKDSGIHYSCDLIEKMESCAIKHNIPFQRGIFKSFKTDGAYFFMQGNPTAMLAIPCRYTHTSFETVRHSDIENALLLLENLLNPQGIVKV